MSIIYFQTCDRRLYISNIVARYPGATNDSYIFANSALRRIMIELNEEERCFLLGMTIITLCTDCSEFGIPFSHFNVFVFPR